ncbi:MAG: 30S ribosomal protein S2 [Candidatus Kerfeldbacteria bacterium]|nr:30S ribosomal protein S2 [Candidatus Kerfeldbacteria bacterium]
MKTPSVVDMLKSGVHFGHRTSRWHPYMAPYIFGVRQNVHIINLQETEAKLTESCQALKSMAAEGKTILFVGTKRQASELVKKYAEEAGMPYVNNRWLGGLLTNFKNVATGARKLTRLKMQKETGELKKYTKKEQLEFDREIEKLQRLVGGIEKLYKMPDALFIVDLNEEKTALAEAMQMRIPVFAMCDTNVNPRDVDYAIPANDDAVKSIDLITSTVSSAIAEGVKEIKTA